MAAEQFLGLEANMDYLRSREMLDAAIRGESSLTAEGWYDLTLLVTESEDQASEAMNEYIRRELRAGKTPQ